jgi:iron(III) transport system substrate-binding protein
MTPRFTRPTVLLAVAAATLTTLAACGGGSSGAGTTPGAAGHETITLDSGQHEQTTDKLVAGFEKATGITVKVRSDDEDVLDDQIQTEGSHSPADVFFTENTMPLQDLANHGLLASIDPSTLKQTPSQYNSPQGKWVGVSARVSVLIYNPAVISKSQLPTTALEMADPKYKGKLAIAPGESDFQPVVTSMLRAYGKARTLQWLAGLKANAGDTHTFPDNETIADEVNRGQVGFGLVNQYYWYRLDAEVGASNDHSQIVPLADGDPGYVLGVAGAGVLASSKHKAAAQQFVAYLTSKAGQEGISHSISFEYPIASGVVTSQPETPLDQLHPNSITLPQLGDAKAAIAVLHEAQLL